MSSIKENHYLAFLNYKPVIRISLFLLFLISYAQETKAQINQDLFLSQIDSIEKNMKFNPKESHNQLKDLYDQIKDETSIQNQLIVAKLMTRINSRSRNNPELPNWYKKVDSLVAISDEDQLDIAYEMTKVQNYIVSKRNSEAFDLLGKIKNPIYETGDTSLIIDWLCRNAGAFNSTEYIDSALTYFLKAQEINKTYNSEACQGLITLVHGNILWEQHQPEASTEKYLEASKYFEKVEDFVNLIPLYRNIVSNTINTNQDELAIEYSNRISALQKKYSSDIGYFTGEINKIFFLITLDKYQEAVDQANNTILLADSLERDNSHAIYLKGVAYRGLKRYDLAIPQIEDAYNKAVALNHNGKITFYSHALYQTYLWDDQFKNALTWHEKYTQYKDSVYNEKNRSEVEILKARFETVQSEMKFEKLAVSATLNNQKKKQYIGLLLFGLFIGASLYYSQIQKRRKEKLIQENELRISNLEKKNLAEKLEFKEKELISQVLNMTHKNVMLQNLKEDLKGLDDQNTKDSVRKVIRKIDKSIDGDQEWSIFLNSFKSVHSSFLDKLNKRNANLTANEIRLSSLLKMNLSSKEIANIFNISNDGVKKARYRLRKKLNLDSEINIQEFLLNL